MGNAVLYFFLANTVILVVLGIRAAYLGFKLMEYIRKNHPEKATEFGCSLDSPWFHRFKFDRALCKKDDAGDPEFARLKTKTRNAHRCLFAMVLFLIIVMALIVMFTILLWIILGNELA